MFAFISSLKTLTYPSLGQLVDRLYAQNDLLRPRPQLSGQLVQLALSQKCLTEDFRICSPCPSWNGAELSSELLSVVRT